MKIINTQEGIKKFLYVLPDNVVIKDYQIFRIYRFWFLVIVT